VLVKDFLSLANHLAGEGGLIIDALLEHGRWKWIPWNVVRIAGLGYHPAS
jgi:hypothetical protein